MNLFCFTYCTADACEGKHIGMAITDQVISEFNIMIAKSLSSVDELYWGCEIHFSGVNLICPSSACETSCSPTTTLQQ